MLVARKWPAIADASTGSAISRKAAKLLTMSRAWQALLQQVGPSSHMPSDFGLQP